MRTALFRPLQKLYAETPITLNTKSLASIFILMAVFLTVAGFAQSTYTLGTLPKFNVNKSLPGGYGVNFKTESRLLFAKGTFEGDWESAFEHGLTEVSLIGSKKAGLANKIAGGYLIRFRDGRIIHRAIQQFSLMSRFNGFRLGHRFSADQSFAGDQKPEIRLRYRLATDLPLNGKVVDPREFYLKLSNEYLNAFQGDDYDLEIRVTPVLGYVFSDENKLEFGPDYRVSSFIGSTTKNSFWFKLSWYLRL